ncbi:MAG: transglutaminase family protein [Rhodoblastus sp.]
MKISFGYEIAVHCPAPTAMICQLDLHPSLSASVVDEQPFAANPFLFSRTYRDSFGNICRRFVAPAGDLVIAAGGVFESSGKPDPVRPQLREIPVGSLPDDTLVYLQGSRYVETDILSQTAWDLFGRTEPGWARVQAICDFVNGHLTFDYGQARSTRTAYDAFTERVGVCRDFTHLAVALCRAMNIPARYCNGYLGDIGVPPDPAPMDFNAWFEVYLEGGWHTFDARHNMPRIGRILVARGRDAADIPMINSFGPHILKSFKVRTDEIKQPHLVCVKAS